MTGEPSPRICGLIPTFDNPQTIRRVVVGLREHLDDVIVVDDGSAEAGRETCIAIAREGLVDVVRRPRNGGKGAAVKTGLQKAQELGFTHALQVDADGQHDLDDVPKLLRVCQDCPDALVLGSPVYDETQPAGRRVGRRITAFWVRVQAGDVIDDAMCGFRVYPVDAALAAKARGDAMDFDPEIAVRMVWAKVPVVNVRTRVRYLEEEDGGVSHFRVVRDNVLISWLHCRLSTQRVVSRFFGGLWRLLRGRPALRPEN